MRLRPSAVLVAVGSAFAILGARNCVRNAQRVPSPPSDPPVVAERVSVLLPARDEAHRITPTVRSLLAQERVPDLEILVLDDNSTDGTGPLVTALAAGDPRVRVLAGRPLAEGWKGKPHACMQLAQAASGRILVFVDADVEFAPLAVAASVATLRSAGLGLLSPFPRQVMGSPIERLYQPMINWTWMVNLPRTVDPATGLPATVVANGQFLVLDADAYRRAGGHDAIKQAVLDDLALLHAVLATGAKAAAVDGTALAACRMYSGPRELVEGYTKWMCDWVDSPRKVAWAAGAIGLIDLLPFVAALRGSKVGLVGYLGPALARAVVARRFAEPAFPYAPAHPAASLMSLAMILESRRRVRRGARTWKGRTV
ncbi:MAG TPA: glycosyltransferase family 2 protein [Sporichthyaceae bacterium]|nr:glycosyltransferase family 2 protein [Sporichthyaceae bacterium]